MSLATRCTSCGTIFKVVQDQLKVSEGWVRCGRCHVVFNALEGLFDLERDAPPARPPAADAAPSPPSEPPPASGADSFAAPADEPAARADLPAPQGGSATAGREPEAPAWIPTEPAPFDDRADSEPPSTREEDALESRWLVRPARDGLSARQRVTSRERDADFSDARFPQDADLDSADDLDDPFLDLAANVAPADAAPRAEPALESSLAQGAQDGQPRRIGSKRRKSAEGPEAQVPGFVRRAERKERWQRPHMRALAALLALALIVVLALQVIVYDRNELNARIPAAHPALAQLCASLGCELSNVQRIEDLSVDSAALSQPTTDEGTYKLLVGLHNHAAIPVAMPHLDLVLSDASGRVLVRRAIAPDELGRGLTRDAALPADSTQNIDLRFTSSQHAIAGYTVEIFYP